MEIVWTDKAKERLKENLEFWDIHNGTLSFFQVKSEDNREYIEIQYFLSSKQKQLF